MRRAWLQVALVGAAVLLVDLLTKNWAQARLRDDAIHLFGSLQLALTYNEGVAFGLGEGVAPILVVVAIAALLLAVIGRRIELSLGSIVGVGLVLGGALGNIGDRIFRDTGGAVVDFIDVGWWPVFNVADAAIVIGSLVIVISGSRRGNGR